MNARMPQQGALPGILSVHDLLRDHYRAIGRLGGLAKTERKSRTSADNLEWARLCAAVKRASLRMEQAREDIGARPPRISIKEYQRELSRYSSVCDQYGKAARKRGILTPWVESKD